MDDCPVPAFGSMLSVLPQCVSVHSSEVGKLTGEIVSAPCGR